MDHASALEGSNFFDLFTRTRLFHADFYVSVEILPKIHIFIMLWLLDNQETILTSGSDKEGSCEWSFHVITDRSVTCNLSFNKYFQIVGVFYA